MLHPVTCSCMTQRLCQKSLWGTSLGDMSHPHFLFILDKILESLAMKSSIYSFPDICFFFLFYWPEFGFLNCSKLSVNPLELIFLFVHYTGKVTSASCSCWLVVKKSKRIPSIWKKSMILSQDNVLLHELFTFHSRIAKFKNIVLFKDTTNSISRNKRMSTLEGIVIRKKKCKRTMKWTCWIVHTDLGTIRVTHFVFCRRIIYTNSFFEIT